MSRSSLGAGGGNEAGHIISSGNPSANNMTGTATIGPVVLDISPADKASFDIQWVGTAVGALKFEISNSYFPHPSDLSGSVKTPIRAGKWVDVTSLFTPAIVQPAGTTNNIAVALAAVSGAMAFYYLRISYTNVSGAGALDVYLSGGAIG